MSRRFLDLSVALETGIASDPAIMLPQITYFTHAMTAPQVASFFEGLKSEELPGGEGWAVEQLSVSTHNGTHLDAPYHHHSTMSHGQRALTIDEVPLEWCFNPGVKLDFRHLPDGHVASAAEVEAELARIGHDLSPGDIVLVNTAAGMRYGEDDYLARGIGMGRAATLYLTGKGMKVCGIDAWGWDAPLAYQKEAIARSGDKRLFWEGHKAGAETVYCHMEKLANLDQLPPTGFEISCFPYKIKAASAGFIRAVAIFTE